MEEITPASQTALETLHDFLMEDGWFPSPVENSTSFRVNYNGKNSQLNCYAQIKGKLDQFMFFALCPVKISEASRLEMAEFLTRANYGMNIGNFEMDFSDGEVRFKSSLDFEGTGLTKALIHRAIYPAVQMMDKYMPGILQVMTGAQSPEQAIRVIEEAKTPESGQAEGGLGNF